MDYVHHRSGNLNCVKVFTKPPICLQSTHVFEPSWHYNVYFRPYKAIKISGYENIVTTEKLHEHSTVELGF